MIAGSARFDEKSGQLSDAANERTSRRGQRELRGIPHGPESVILFEREGDEIAVSAEDDGARFVLVTGQPIGEPVAWSGPIGHEYAKKSFARLFKSIAKARLSKSNKVIIAIDFRTSLLPSAVSFEQRPAAVRADPVSDDKRYQPQKSNSEFRLYLRLCTYCRCKQN